jgi:hypothetical protein
VFVLNASGRVCASAYSMLANDFRCSRVIWHGVQMGGKRYTNTVLCDIVLCPDPRDGIVYEMDHFALRFFWYSYDFGAPSSWRAFIDFSFDRSDSRRVSRGGPLVGGVLCPTKLVTESVVCDCSGRRFQFARLAFRRQLASVADHRKQYRLKFGYPPN